MTGSGRPVGTGAPRPPAARARDGARLLVAAILALLLAVAGAPAAVAADDPGPTTTTTGAPATSTTTTSTPPTEPTTTTTTTDPGASGDDPASPPLSPPVTLAPADVDALRSLTSEYEVAGDEEAALFDKYLAMAERALSLSDQVRDLNAHVAAAQAVQAEGERKLADAEAHARDLVDQAGRADEDLAREEARLREQALQAYMGGELQSAEAPVDAVARAGSMNELGATLVYANAVVVDRREIIRRVTDLQRRLQELTDESDAAVADAQRRRDELKGAQDEVERQRDQAAVLQLALLDQASQDQVLLQEIADRRATYSEKIAALARVSDTISVTLAERQQGQTLPALTAGIFLAPIPNPRFNSPFGPRVDPVFGTGAMHNGVDINGQLGTPIRAAADGTVVIAAMQGGYGNCTVIDHGSGLGTLYGHQSKILVTVGQTVKKGDVIGLVGSTGKSTGPHLHWEVRRFGQPTDPVPFIGPG